MILISCLLSISVLLYVSSDGGVPTQFFAHFTGQQKPWMVDLTSLDSKKAGNRNLFTWAAHLDALKMDVNSSNIFSRRLGSPLGFFNANFPKGGYKTKSGNKKKRKLERSRDNKKE